MVWKWAEISQSSRAVCCFGQNRHVVVSGCAVGAPLAKGRTLSERNALDDFHALCAELGITAARNSFHPLRHTMATNYVRNGGDVARLQRILGHTSITTTLKYVHIQTEDLSLVHERFSVLGKAVK